MLLSSQELGLSKPTGEFRPSSSVTSSLQLSLILHPFLILPHLQMIPLPMLPALCTGLCDDMRLHGTQFQCASPTPYLLDCGLLEAWAWVLLIYDTPHPSLMPGQQKMLRDAKEMVYVKLFCKVPHSANPAAAKTEKCLKAYEIRRFISTTPSF